MLAINPLAVDAGETHRKVSSGNLELLSRHADISVLEELAEPKYALRL